MTDGTNGRRDDHDRKVDARNRHLAQEAQTDTELESMVPPTWGPGMWWRIGIAVLAVIILALLMFRAIGP
ncbi:MULTISPECIES: hypothetical protein [unclassified Roseitalea]|uniref:hypothetical protein n=1 Tax=unclassified Roseitalea TaxID=2639107 RepID=UPI00273F8C9B|nr:MULTISPECIES: hypothetical protein [unclassified Roseitalea]